MTAPVSMAERIVFALNERIKNRNLFPVPRWNQVNMVIEDNSIFNKHLDEILYFFQVTDYNVVIIEDLDRFGTPNIFLKLRELNQLINESKIVGRHITFIYAIKDDIFKDEERTKFFDFITTVIPVINPSNSNLHLRQKDTETMVLVMKICLKWHFSFRICVF